MAEALELIAALDERTWSLETEALGCGCSPRRVLSDYNLWKTRT